MLVKFNEGVTTHMAKAKKAAKAAKGPAKPVKKAAPRGVASSKPSKMAAKPKSGASRSAKPAARRVAPKKVAAKASPRNAESKKVAPRPKKTAPNSKKAAPKAVAAVRAKSVVKPATQSRVKASPAPKRSSVAMGRATIGSKIAVKSSQALVSIRASQSKTKKFMPTNSKETAKEVKPGGGIVQPATRTTPAMRLRADDAEILATAKERYGRKDLEMFRKLIQEQQQETREEFDILSQNILDTSGEFEADNQTYSLHTAEQGTDAIEREKTFLHAQRTSDYLKKLEESLERIDRGTYGICVICGNLIEKERLQAVPITQKHVDCKNRTQIRKVSNGSGFHDVEEQPVNLD